MLLKFGNFLCAYLEIAIMQNVTANWRWPHCVASEQTLFSYTVALDAMSVNYSCVTSCHLANEISVRICNSYIVGEKLKVEINQQKMYLQNSFIYITVQSKVFPIMLSLEWFIGISYHLLFLTYLFSILVNHDFYKRTICDLGDFYQSVIFFVLNAGTIAD